MQKVISKYSSFKDAERADAEYYNSLTMRERMDIFFQILKAHNDVHYPNSSRLERVARVFKRKNGYLEPIK